MASKIYHLFKKSAGLINSTSICSLLNKHQYRPIVSFPQAHFTEKQGFGGFLNFCTMPSEKIYILKNTAIQAGALESYYLNPSENLMKMASEWNVVEHEGFLALTIDMFGFGDEVSVNIDGKFIKILVSRENEEKAARFCDKNGMRNFSFEMNPNFLNLLVQDDPTLKVSGGTFRLFISKLKTEEMKKPFDV